jgi:hypothetical protein
MSVSEGTLVTSCAIRMILTRNDAVSCADGKFTRQIASSGTTMS